MNSWPDSADSADRQDPADQVSLSAAWSLPSTRAGGQDDVSLNKLPQIKLPVNQISREQSYPASILLYSP